MNRNLEQFEQEELREDFDAWLAQWAVWLGLYRLPKEHQRAARNMIKRAYYAGDKRRRMMNEPVRVGGDGWD